MAVEPPHEREPGGDEDDDHRVQLRQGTDSRVEPRYVSRVRHPRTGDTQEQAGALLAVEALRVDDHEHQERCPCDYEERGVGEINPEPDPVGEASHEQRARPLDYLQGPYEPVIFVREDEGQRHQRHDREERREGSCQPRLTPGVLKHKY
ncbi:MAG: hypothetical protein M3N45_02055 [Actinomycetota bacterium]|nr:hypothetical protein [Actinomycetota bacterium]